MTRPTVSAMYSGLIVPPPTKLNLFFCGTSRANGAPTATQTASGNRMSRPIATGQTGGRTPVASCRRVQRRDHARVPTIQSRKAPSTHKSGAVTVSKGKVRPRFDQKKPGTGLNEPANEGKLRFAPYQNSNCSGSGTSRSAST